MRRAKIVGIVGRSQSGKDTLAKMLVDAVGDGEIIAFATPMKTLVSIVFQFDHDTLYGPSELRNKPDVRYGATAETLKHRFSGWFRRNEIDQNKVKAAVRFHDYRNQWLIDLLGSDYAERYRHAGTSLTEWFYEVTTARKVITPRYILQTLGDWGRKLNPNLWADAAINRASRNDFHKAPIVIISDVRYPATEAKLIRDAGGELWRIRRPGVDFLHVEKAGIKGHSSESQIDSLEMDALVTKNIPNDSTLEVLRERVRAAMKERGLT